MNKNILLQNLKHVGKASYIYLDLLYTMIIKL